MTKTASDPTVVESMTKEQKVLRVIEIDQTIEDLLAERQVVEELVAGELSGDGEVIGDYAVEVKQMTFIDVTLEQARQWGGTKIKPEKIVSAEEVVDTPKLQKMRKSGVDIPVRIVKKIKYSAVEK
jgi:hypothetical protein